MTQSPKIALWRSTPPAVFPSLLGLFGLGLGWRKAAEAFHGLGWVGEGLLWLTLTLYLVAALSYLAKVLARPEALAQDMSMIPGQAGVGAITIGPMLIAIMMLDYAPMLTLMLLGLALLGHGGLAFLVVRPLLALPKAHRPVSPALHLNFVGFIICAISATALGLGGLSYVILLGTLAISGVIYAQTLPLSAQTPPPLRPLMAIHLAPPSLFCAVSLGLGHIGLAMVFAGLASALLGLLVYKAQFLTAAGFSPLWGAFTFPLAAYSIAMLGLHPHSAIFSNLGALVLVGATVVIPFITVKVLRLWVSGKLAQLTKAASV